MKKLISFLFVLSFVILFIPSCETENQVTNSSEYSLNEIDQQLDELEKQVTDLTNSIFADTKDPKACGNIIFPGGNATGTMTFKECEFDEDINISVLKTCKLWANYAPKGQPLGLNACNKNLEVGLPKIVGIVKTQSGNKPKLKWSFVYCHYFIIDRSIGNTTSWQTVGIIDCCSGGAASPNYNCGTTLEWIDNGGINLSTITENIYYRIRAKSFSTYSLSYQLITYSPPSVNVYISGPTSLKSGQSGTFTANAVGGVLPYNYSWKKLQYCNDKSNSETDDNYDGTKSEPCGYWRPIGGNTKTLYASGSPPMFKLQVTVTDQNGSDVDVHVINVSPW